MTHPLRARVDLAALRDNYRHARGLAPGARALAVVKANAYGHGAVPVARALDGEADGFAVAWLDEALELRESGIRAPIVVLDGVSAPDELRLVEQAGLTPVIHARHQLDWFLAARPMRPLDCWLKVDTGMHRLGFAPAALLAAHAALSACPHLGSLVLMTHFACADVPEHPQTAAQLARFTAASAGLGIRRPASLANSAALLTCPPAHADWTRPGLLLYGVSPLAEPAPALHAALRPVLQLESTVIAVRELAAGEPVGYGARFRCERALRIGTVAIGYADGYPRHAPDGTPVAVGGHLTRLIGRVSMDLITVDLTGLDQAGVGTPVELWGTRVPVSAVARASGTIPYQLLTGLGRRAARHHADA